MRQSGSNSEAAPSHPNCDVLQANQQPAEQPNPAGCALHRDDPVIARNNKARLRKRRRAQAVLVSFFLPFCSLIACAELPALLDPNRESSDPVQLANGEQWAPPIGCTVPWGIAESAQSDANVKRIDDFPGDADWVNVSGNGAADNPLVIISDRVVTKMVKIREGSSYVILDGLTIRPEPSRDFGWAGADVLIEGGTHHIAIRNCTLLSTSDAEVTQALTTSDPDITQPPETTTEVTAEPTLRQRTLLTTQPTRGRYVEYVTVFKCTAGPLGDWTQNEGTDYGGLSFPAGTKHVRVFDCTISGIGGDAIGFPNETMLAARGDTEFPTTDIQIGRCVLERCKENLVDCKLVQDMIVSECTLSLTNAYSTSSRGDAFSITGASQAILDEHGGVLPWMSPNRVWLLFNEIREVSRGAIFATLETVPSDMKGKLYSVGNAWTNIRAEGRGSGSALIAHNGNAVFSFGDVFTNVDIPTTAVTIENDSPQDAFREAHGRELERLP
jgi:hypothetical protein